MNYSDFEAQIKAIGRTITPAAVLEARTLIAQFIDSDLFNGITIKRNISYGENERHRLDVFTANDQKGLKPVLLFVHGGGFISGDKDSPDSPFYSNIAAWAVRQGLAGVNMTYRLAPEHPWPAGIEDLRSTIEWIQHVGEQYGLDANNIFAMGQSAGGTHIAGYLAHPELVDGAPHGLSGAILLSSVYDFVAMPTRENEKAYLGEDESLYYQRSSLDGLLGTDIPLLVTMSEYDPPEFQAQTLQLLNAWLGKHGELPRYVHMLGQNHISTALYLGLPDDLLAPQLQRFIADNLG